MNAPWDADYDPQAAKDEVLCFAAEVEAIGKKYHLPILLIVGLPKTGATIYFHAGLSNQMNRDVMAAEAACALLDAQRMEAEGQK